MNFSSLVIENAVEQLSKFPGIGKKSALRMVLYLMKENENNVQQIGISINKLKTDLQKCKFCYNVSDYDVCSICKSPNRDKKMICVVEEFHNIISIENTGQFKGLYHVLGGLISPIDGIGPNELTISSLIERIQNEQIQELVIALNTTMEGDATQFYITKKTAHLPIQVTVLSRGISVGSELEYADEITLGRAISNRTQYSI